MKDLADERKRQKMEDRKAKSVPEPFFLNERRATARKICTDLGSGFWIRSNRTERRERRSVPSDRNAVGTHCLAKRCRLVLQEQTGEPSSPAPPKLTIAQKVAPVAKKTYDQCKLQVSGGHLRSWGLAAFADLSKEANISAHIHR